MQKCKVSCPKLFSIHYDLWQTNCNLEYNTILKVDFLFSTLNYTNIKSTYHTTQNTPSPSSCMFQSQRVSGVRCGRAACCLVWCLCEWSPENGWRPVPAPLLPCRIVPTLLGCHSCWSESPGLHRAWTPSPNKGTSHLGTHSKAMWTEREREREVNRCHNTNILAVVSNTV